MKPGRSRMGTTAVRPVIEEAAFVGRVVDAPRIAQRAEDAAAEIDAEHTFQFLDAPHASARVSGLSFSMDERTISIASCRSRRIASAMVRVARDCRDVFGPQGAVRHQPQ